MYLIEVGLVLVVVPWTTFWDRNYFIEWHPVVNELLTAPVIRGAVSGVGVVALGAAVVECVTAVRRRLRGRRDTADSVLASVERSRML